MAIIPTPRELIWHRLDTSRKTLTFSNTNGLEDLWLEIDPTPVGAMSESAYYCPPLPRTLMRRGNQPRSIAHPVSPPQGTNTTPPPVVQGVINYRVINAAGQVMPGTIPCRNDATSAVTFGQVQITAVMPDPPGDDLLGEGEYIEITNVSGAELNLAGCRISHLRNVHVANAQPALTRAFPVTPDPADFGRRSRLLPLQTLRVLTRAKRAVDPAHHPLRYYLGSQEPIWNNDGDRVTVLNADGQMVATFGFGKRDGAPNYNGPTQAVPDRPQQRVILRDRFVVTGTGGPVPIIELHDGDVLDIVTDEEGIARQFKRDGRILPGTVGVYPFSPEFLPSGRSLLILPRRIGEPTDAPADHRWPMQGAPKYALYAEFGVQNRIIGPGGLRAEPISLDQPAMLFLGINDDVRWDNRGQYIVQVTVFRD